MYARVTAEPPRTATSMTLACLQHLSEEQQQQDVVVTRGKLAVRWAHDHRVSTTTFVVPPGTEATWWDELSSAALECAFQLESDQLVPQKAVEVALFF